MVQIANALEDIFVDDWDSDRGTGVDLFASIFFPPPELENPNPPEDNTFIVSETSPSNDVYVFKLESILNTETLEGNWIIKFRAQKMIDDATQLDLLVQLRQNYEDEVEQGELIFEELFEEVAFGYQDFEMVMVTPDLEDPDGPADIDPSTIDADNLFVRLVANES